MWLEHEKLTQSARSSPTASGSTKSPKKYNVRNNSFDPEKALPQIISEVPLRGARNPPHNTIFDYLPVLLIFKPIWAVPRWIYRRVFKKQKARLVDEETGQRSWTGKKQLPPVIDSNVPLEITLFLHSYVAFLLQKGLVQAAVATNLFANLGMLQDTVNNLERVRSTPIPFAYQAHLRMSLWLYLAFLPFQVISTMSWFTIPGTCFASFLLLGFLEIGQEMYVTSLPSLSCYLSLSLSINSENPFNYDENDLDMDSFCLQITREIHEITAVSFSPQLRPTFASLTPFLPSPSTPRPTLQHTSSPRTTSPSRQQTAVTRKRLFLTRHMNSMRLKRVWIRLGGPF